MTSTALRGLENARFLETRGDRDIYMCTVCERPMQAANTTKGSAPLPGVPRHGAEGKCNACYRASRPDRAPGIRKVGRPSNAGKHAVIEVLTHGLEWADRAACGRAPRPDAFAMPDEYRGGGPTTEAVEVARRYCARCPVITECGEFADAQSCPSMPITGVWGGEWRTTVAVTPIATKATA